MLSGKPACKKQEANWTWQAATALPHELEAEKGGRGLEDHFPHLYSQLGGGEAVTVAVQRETVVLVVGDVVEGVLGDVVGDLVERVEHGVEDVVGDVVGDLVEGLEHGVEDVFGDVFGDVVGDLVEVVDHVVAGVVGEVVVVLAAEEVEDDEDGGGALHGSEDSRSFATYRFKDPLPPQVSVLSPVQGVLHEVAGNGAVPLPKTTPQ